MIWSFFIYAFCASTIWSKKKSNRFKIIISWSVLRWVNSFWNIFHYFHTAGEFSSYLKPKFFCKVNWDFLIAIYFIKIFCSKMMAIRFLERYFSCLDFLFEFCFRYNKQCMGMECDCEVVPKGLQGCGETCLNRQLLMECPPTCNNTKCSNKRFQVG